ncbi:unnamed protein product [Dovyalis caffra]|uniref:Uncharacterized protein n=1 Tax=Dovyalis caffra TaxID=77055 RepID=A0AAV1R175_9ROSI|nr:unnamed protein product [Dovyalis caffra]
MLVLRPHFVLGKLCRSVSFFIHKCSHLSQQSTLRCTKLLWAYAFELPTNWCMRED